MTTMYWKSALQALMTFAAAAMLVGCSSTALPPGRSVLEVAEAKSNTALATNQQAPAFPAHSSGFEWAQRTLQATGQGSSPPAMTGPQTDLMARNSATVHALTNLKDQVKRLPVGTDQTVGSIMDTYITVRHAVEQEIASAQVIGSRPLPNGTTEVQVALPMQRIATILQQYQITPDQELPQTAETNPAVPDVI